jgi:hypothetical protein
MGLSLRGQVNKVIMLSLIHRPNCAMSVATIPRTRKPAKSVSQKTRAADGALRKRLENLEESDFKKFDDAAGESNRPTA